MAKNTQSSGFRNVDVDMLDPERYQEDAGDDSGKIMSDADITSLLMSKKKTEALQLALASAPLGAQDKAVKDRGMSLMLQVLMSFKSAEVEDAVKSLDTTLLDVLMKYIYRGFETPTDNSSAVLLVWHEKVLAAAGLGCIIRVLTDRKRV